VPHPQSAARETLVNEMHVSATMPRAVEPFRHKEIVTAPAGKIGILLVDDQHSLRRMLGRALHEAGFWVVEAASGEEALQLLPQQAAGVQLLITDVMMPGINGAELARRVLRQRPDIRVLFISGCAGNLLDPGTPFLQKPFSTKVLLREIAALLDPPNQAHSKTA
jgi:CheY-like chemotaxis protein